MWSSFDIWYFPGGKNESVLTQKTFLCRKSRDLRRNVFGWRWTHFCHQENIKYQISNELHPRLVYSLSLPSFSSVCLGSACILTLRAWGFRLVTISFIWLGPTSRPNRISYSPGRLRDLRDSMCTKFTLDSWKRKYIYII